MSDPLQRITVDPLICGGQPCVRGPRIPVASVLRHLRAGPTAEQILDELPELEADDIEACLRFAARLASGRAILLPPAGCP